MSSAITIHITVHPNQSLPTLSVQTNSGYDSLVKDREVQWAELDEVIAALGLVGIAPKIEAVRNNARKIIKDRILAAENAIKQLPALRDQLAALEES